MFWKKKTDKPVQQQEETSKGGSDDIRTNIIKAVARGVKEQRKHIRVKYPVAGALGDLPQVEVKGQMFAPGNLSQGGVLLKLPFKDLIEGQRYPLKVVWKYGPLIFNHESELLRIRNDHFHFKFVKIDSRSFMEFSKSFSAGIRGAQSRPVTGEKAPAYLLEFWQNSQGDKILFQKTSQGHSADFFFDGYRITFTPQQGLLREEENEKKEWRLVPARQEVVDEIIIFLTNISEPTQRISTLLQEILKRHYSAAGNFGSQSSAA